MTGARVAKRTKPLVKTALPEAANVVPFHPRAEAAPASAVPFDRLAPFACRWIYGVASMTAPTCGQRCEFGLSWCPTHAARCFVRRPGKKKI